MGTSLPLKEFDKGIQITGVEPNMGHKNYRSAGVYDDSMLAKKGMSLMRMLSEHKETHS